MLALLAILHVIGQDGLTSSSSNELEVVHSADECTWKEESSADSLKSIVVDAGTAALWPALRVGRA